MTGEIACLSVNDSNSRYIDLKSSEGHEQQKNLTIQLNATKIIIIKKVKCYIEIEASLIRDDKISLKEMVRKAKL